MIITYIPSKRAAAARRVSGPRPVITQAIVTARSGRDVAQARLDEMTRYPPGVTPGAEPDRMDPEELAAWRAFMQAAWQTKTEE